MHLLILGAPYDLVVRNSRVSTRTLRFWVQHFNDLGVDGLIHRLDSVVMRLKSKE